MGAGSLMCAGLPQLSTAGLTLLFLPLKLWKKLHIGLRAGKFTVGSECTEQCKMTFATGFILQAKQ